ncbi:oligosaccharide flippase family protein [Natronococcus sp. JC468]|uniref:lipopolysaccharide biosynthesis protein n=1 Tax=Natronococcus sp. JC468 TaxID=1961921 RepID=UPI00143ADDAD|nr:polysaccharide biosynthesis C-terminal domain-containing protein [Natronococcus sp. JC468]NKE36548.1 oligosaccharide flippase family protein [Natronococcus sp. JC468]
MTSIFTRFISVIGSKFGTLLITLIYTPIFVRLLGSGGYGDYSLILAILSVLMTFINAGVFDGVRKFISEDRDYDKWEMKVFAYYFRMAILLLLVVSLGIVISVFSGISDLILGAEFRYYFLLAIFILVFRQVFAVSRAALMGIGAESVSEPLGIINKLIFTLVAVSLLLLGFDIYGVLLAEIISLSVIVLLSFIYLRNYIDFSYIIKPIGEEFPKHELNKYKKQSVVLVLLLTTLYKVDIILLNPIAGSTETGYYRAALTIAEFLWFIPMALQMTLLQSTSEFWSNGQIGKVNNISSRITRYTILLVSLLSIGIAILSKSFIPLYFGEEFSDAVLPLLILIPGAFFFSILRPMLSIGQASGNLRPLVISTTIAALLNIVLNLLLIPKYGMYGAATATSLSYGSMFVFHIWAVYKIGFDPFQDLRLLSIVATVLSSGGLLFVVDRLISSQLLSIIVVPPLGLFIFILFSIAYKSISAQEIQVGERKIQNIIHKLE